MFAAAAVVLAATAVAARIPARVLALRGAVVLPLLVLLALTVPLREDDAVVAAAAAKALVGTTAAVLLGATTTFPDVLHAMERLRVPPAATRRRALMYRYLFVVAGEARRMRLSLQARGYAPRSALQAGAIGRVAVALFLRSHDRGERVQLAMRARGHSGRAPAPADPRARPRGRRLPVRRRRGAPAPSRRAGGGGVIAARGLRYRYPSGAVALDGVDLHVARGERVAVLGPNGAGKTTLMLHLNGLLHGDGELRVCGEDPRAADLRARVGLVFQDPDDQLFMPTRAARTSPSAR